MGPITGRVHSIQSMGTLDGPGVRFVAFMQGCPLRCACCHNPDTWAADGGTPYTPAALVGKAVRFREYFGRDGGVTVSGGEPLLQSRFVAEYFRLCHEAGLHTCLDTSGCILTDEVIVLLEHTDRVLLDIKYTSDEKYRRYAGCPLDAPLRFLGTLQRMNIPTTLRQVIIPGLSDDEANILALREIARAHPVVDKIELLPFRKLCQTKYDAMGVPFPLAGVSEPAASVMDALRARLAD